jgi:hypothetical protein
VHNQNAVVVAAGNSAKEVAAYAIMEVSVKDDGKRSIGGLTHDHFDMPFGSLFNCQSCNGTQRVPSPTGLVMPGGKPMMTACPECMEKPPIPQA